MTPLNFCACKARLLEQEASAYLVSRDVLAESAAYEKQACSDDLATRGYHLEVTWLEKVSRVDRNP